MAEVILMPRLSDTMTEGVIAAWHKKVGDKVKKGDLLAIIGASGEDISSLIKGGGQASEKSESPKKAEPKKEMAAKSTTSNKQPAMSNESATATSAPINIS